MFKTLFDADYCDHSARTGFSTNTIDRQAEKRSPNCVADVLAEPTARLLVIGDARILLQGPEGGPFECWYTAEQAEALGCNLKKAILLGRDPNDIGRLAVPLSFDPENPPADHQAPDFRSTYIAGFINDNDLGALAQGAALLAWHQSHKHCSRCGSESIMADGGYKRTCPNCQAQHFPRTDPVVIMLTVSPDNEHVLLGRNPHFPEGMFSCLAGFVEPGETLENAVRRETIEETGVRVGPVCYHASQPWPFPYTLMIGMYGLAESEAIKVDDELEDARWFSRHEIRQMIAGNHPDGIRMPPKGAIAWRLVEDWADA